MSAAGSRGKAAKARNFLSTGPAERISRASRCRLRWPSGRELEQKGNDSHRSNSRELDAHSFSHRSVKIAHIGSYGESGDFLLYFTDDCLIRDSVRLLHKCTGDNPTVGYLSLEAIKTIFCTWYGGMKFLYYSAFNL